MNITSALEQLKKGDFEQRWEASNLLTKLGTQAINPLIEIAENPANTTEVRWFALRALGEFKVPKVMVALINILSNTEDEELVEMASQGLGKMGSISAPSLIELLANGNKILPIVKALAYISTEETTTVLMEMANHPVKEIREVVIEALGSCYEEGVLAILLSALQDTSAKVRKEAASALGRRGNQENIAILIQHLSPLVYDLNPEVCQQTVLSLGRLGSVESVEILGELLCSKTIPLSLKQDIVIALSWINELQSLNYLRQGLSHNPPYLCNQIIHSLGRVNSNLKQLATRILLDLDIANLENDTKLVLAAALGELQQPDSKEILEKLSEDKNTRVGLQAIAALKKLP